MEIVKIVSKELDISELKIINVIKLLDGGATIPFIARYRKEATGNLDEVQLINIRDRNSYWDEFQKRMITILQTIKEQGKLTAQLQEKIKNIKSLSALEDLYLPYKPKRKTKGQIAIEKGLKPLAIYIQKESNDDNIIFRAQTYIKADIQSEEQALDGAVNILAEWISEDSWVRDNLRSQFDRHAEIVGTVKRGKKESGDKYKDYFKFRETIKHIAAHRVLALLRGEKEGVLNIKIEVDEEKAVNNIERVVLRKYSNNSYVLKAIDEAYDRILLPNFDSEFKKVLKEKADIESIKVFAENLKQLLLQSPLGSKNILAIDPGFRSGCKVVVLDKNSSFVYNTTIYPHPPQNKLYEAEEILKKLVNKYQSEAIAVGDGTAGLETEKLCRRIFKDTDIQVFSVNEAGASIYSASEIAREEFPDLDLTVRGAISIGRRLIDPLQELVKIDAKSIGVGQYQHDVNQTLLKKKLIEVVEHSVNHVGVELNTASFPILSYVSGLGPTIAKSIVKYRDENGDFTNRKQLLKVPKLGKKTYEQAAGFLRIETGDNPLDNTIIHPETYPIVKEIANASKVKIEELLVQKAKIDNEAIKELKDRYDHFTLSFILSELQKPTRDPREALKMPEYNDISSIENLYPQMILSGKINNITKFGAFVDIGIKESGLVHISQISNTFIKDIQSVVRLGQQVKVKVLEVDIARKRIQLSMKI